MALAVLAPRVWPRHLPFHGSGRRHSAFPPVPLRLVRRLRANPAHPPQRDSGKRTTFSTSGQDENHKKENGKQHMRELVWLLLDERQPDDPAVLEVVA